MTEKMILEKNSMLVREFDKYILEHPEFSDSIPDDALVPRDCVARNRGADCVKCLAPAPCAGTRHLTGHRAPHMQAALACTAPCAGQRRDYP